MKACGKWELIRTLPIDNPWEPTRMLPVDNPGTNSTIGNQLVVVRYLISEEVQWRIKTLR